MNRIKIVDLFAGAGGLGEGFSSFTPDNGKSFPFQVVLSAEKMPEAVETLRLRKFFRLCQQTTGIPESYYSYIRGETQIPYDEITKANWTKALTEVQPLELGTAEGDSKFKEGLQQHIADSDGDWILVGGPPCQAYSLVGRARNKGVDDYRPEKDNRHFLYREYLNILSEHRPIAFIMENVKGILSSRVDGAYIFPQILQDLASPSNCPEDGVRYRIHSFVSDEFFEHGDNPSDIDPQGFIIRSEDFGLPQARHRVILLGIREEGFDTPAPSKLSTCEYKLSVMDALGGLPVVRSGLSKGDNGTEHWMSSVAQAVSQAIQKVMDVDSTKLLQEGLERIESSRFVNDRGGRFVKNLKGENVLERSKIANAFVEKMQDLNMGGVPNHFARGHMQSDLVRYLYATMFAEKHACSPKAQDFPDALAPEHKNWRSGSFSDRFRVQLKNYPSSTVVSHISKDGHYYIHPDPSQCRSLTVREAARLQTFPDNYFFEGNRTQQYIQVGNAVPPMLAEKIAEIIYKMIC